MLINLHENLTSRTTESCIEENAKLETRQNIREFFTLASFNLENTVSSDQTFKALIFSTKPHEKLKLYFG